MQLIKISLSEKNEILGIYDAEELTFEAADLLDIEPADLNHLPSFLAPNWLRLDGVSARE